jgi:hypothetical protein
MKYSSQGHVATPDPLTLELLNEGRLASPKGEQRSSSSLKSGST